MKNLLINRALAAKKTKLFTFFLALVASVGTMFAEKVKIGDLYYDLNATNKTAEVTSQNSSYPYWSTTIKTANIPGSVTYNSVKYSVTSIGSYAFWDCTGLTSVTIPNSVTTIGDDAFAICTGLTSVTIGNSVTSIGDRAFERCTGLTSVTIPNSVTSIGYGAFSDCSSLTSVTIPNSVTSIGESAFYGCSGLTSVTIPNSVTSIGDRAISWCTGLTSVTIPNSVTSIGDRAFFGCSGLTSVTIPNSVTSIGDWAFSDCTSLTSVNITDIAAWCNIAFSSDNSNPLYYAKHLYVNDVEVNNLVIPEGVTSIGAYAFVFCTGLTSVTIGNSVTSIGGSAFESCSGLTSVTIGNSVTSIGGSAFESCTGLTSVTIGNSVTSIGDFAFRNCSGLTSVTIPNSVTSIGDYAFWDCTGLTSVTIGNSVTSIGGSAFFDCSSLTSVTIPNSVTSIGESAFYGCSGLTSVTIPNSVTRIGNSAFCNCSGLTSVTIGNSVTSIGGSAFYGCSSLTSVTIEAETPPTLGSDVFYTNYCPIYVPCGTLDSYKTAEGWSKYQYRIKYAPYPSYAITKKAENGNITTSSTDFTMCDAEHPVICTANPDRGFYFVRWADGNTENPRTIELTQDTTMEAIFDYLLTGKCGKDSALTWTFEPASMALNITGKGALSENYTYGTFIESLTIGNEINTIGERAFYGCSGLKNVILGSSVKVLEQGAFYNCSSIESITCYSQRPPTVNQDALYGLDYSTIVYVPADYLETYKMHDVWGLYDVRPLGAKNTETADLNVTPAETTADVAWPAVSGAATYELVIKDKSGNVICTLVFNANGQLTQIAFNAPSRNNAPQQTQAAGFSFTVTGLEEGTSYDLTITSKDNNGGTLDTKTVSFTTTGESQGIEDVLSDQVQCTKVIKNGQIFILRGEKVYSLTGQEVR